MLQEEGSELTLGPEVHGVGQELGGNCVDAKEVADKHHALDFLPQRRKQVEKNLKRKPENRRSCNPLSQDVDRGANFYHQYRLVSYLFKTI